MRRRRFVEMLGAATVAGPVAAAGGVTGRELAVFSASSLVGADGEAMPTGEAALLTESTARTRNNDGFETPVRYTGAVPVAAVDGSVVGVGSPLVADGEAAADNVAAYLDAWDALVEGSTVLWDEGHDTRWTYDRFEAFDRAAAGRGYDVRPTSFLGFELDDADAVVMMPPGWQVWEETRTALAEFVADGGTLFLHNQADYRSRDATGRLNRVCTAVDAGFRFNDDQVIDRRRNTGEEYRPLTTNVPADSPFAGSGGGGGGSDELVASIEGPTAVPSEQTVTFDGSGSVDPDGRVVGYEWSFDDGTSAVGEVVEHAWLFAGDYRVSLTVEAADGATDTAVTTVSVGDGESGGGGATGDRVAVPVTGVSDGDTIDVEYEGSEESIRILGVDTAETPSNQQYEREEEWEGIDSLSTLGEWGRRGSEYAQRELSVGDTVEIAFDEAEGRRDPFDRLLAYVYYDADGTGSRDTLYNEKLVRDGYARVYGSSLTRHDDIWRAEQAARSVGRGVWAESTFALSDSYRNRPVETVFVPEPAPVTTATGTLADDRVPVRGGEGARPLAAVDEDARVGVVGGLMVDETYESEEGFDGDTASYDNYTFVSNLLEYLADREGAVLVDGGHGQFGADYALSTEDMAYYGRHLEGEGVECHQVNSMDETDVSIGRAMVVTPPATDFTFAERMALSSFRDAGGAVLLMGSGTAPAAARRRLNDLAEELGSDLRLDTGTVRDPESALGGDPALVTTGDFERSLPLFDRFRPGTSEVGDPGAPDDPGDDDGSEGETPGATYTGSLGPGESATHEHAVSTDGGLTVTLSGPSSADFDLYVTGDGRAPTSVDYDYKSWSFGADEEVAVPASGVGATVGVMIDCFSGSGDYTVTVTPDDADGGDPGDGLGGGDGDDEDGDGLGGGDGDDEDGDGLGGGDGDDENRDDENDGGGWFDGIGWL